MKIKVDEFDVRDVVAVRAGKGGEGLTPGDGGHLRFQAGAAGQPCEAGGFKKGKDGSIIFSLADGTEVLRFDPGNVVKIFGEEVKSETARRVSEALEKWLGL